MHFLRQVRSSWGKLQSESQEGARPLLGKMNFILSCINNFRTSQKWEMDVSKISTTHSCFYFGVSKREWHDIPFCSVENWYPCLSWKKEFLAKMEASAQVSSKFFFVFFLVPLFWSFFLLIIFLLSSSVFLVLTENSETPIKPIARLWERNTQKLQAVNLRAEKESLNAEFSLAQKSFQTLQMKVCFVFFLLSYSFFFSFYLMRKRKEGGRRRKKNKEKKEKTLKNVFFSFSFFLSSSFFYFFLFWVNFDSF